MTPPSLSLNDEWKLVAVPLAPGPGSKVILQARGPGWKACVDMAVVRLTLWDDHIILMLNTEAQVQKDRAIAPHS